MGAINWETFFEDRTYREMCLQYIVLSIKYWLETPIIICRGIYDYIKLYIDYPNRLEREAVIKERERENQIAEKKVIAYSNLIITIYSFDCLLLDYCTYISQENPTEEEYKMLCEGLAQVKKDFDIYLSKLEWMDIVIPDELKTNIRETAIDRFSDLNECKVFLEKIHKNLQTIEIFEND